MIVGTAGHIDHGKTSLVKALSGVDTDRLPEERARGISIDLGYAYVPVDATHTIGFVDVPGHEKFVHTMLAGAAGIDFALLVVAADDGVMPQTREHLAILTMLGIRDGAIAITKVDAADASQLAACEREMRALVAECPLRDAPVFAVSSKTGEGIAALDAHLRHIASTVARTRREGRFRLAVDRSFTLQGIGTVVTGTIYSGEVRVGDRLLTAPSGREVRVRSLHAQGAHRDAATAGQRCALNLAPISREEVGRGDWIVDPAIFIATDRLDARITLGDDVTMLRAGSEVHVHLAASHTTARVVPLAEGLVQLVLRERVAAWRGDCLVLRDGSATQTIGGGTILDPLPPLRYRRSEPRLAILDALQRTSPAEQLAALVEVSAEGIDVRAFEYTGNLSDASGIARMLPARHVATARSEFVVSEPAWQRLTATAIAALDKFHHAHGDLLGLDRSRLRRIAFPRLDASLYRALVDALIGEECIRESRALLHLPGHDNALSAQERALVDAATPRLLERPFDPPWVRDLARDMREPELAVRSALMRAAKRGELNQVVHDLFYHPAAIDDLAHRAAALEVEEGTVTAAKFRDRTGLGRKRAIQVLEYFDRIGYTRRVRDSRMIRPGSPLAQPSAP